MGGIRQCSANCRRTCLLTALVAAVRAAVIAEPAAPAPAPALAESSASPVGKVVELLGTLGKQLAKEESADANQQGEYLAWFAKEKTETERQISAAKKNIESLEADLKQGEAFRTQQGQTLEKVSGEQAKAEQELKSATLNRDMEQKAFAATESDLAASTDQLERAMEVLAKRAPAADATAFLEGRVPRRPGGVALLDAAKNLRKTLQGGDFDMTPAQKELLDNLVRFAADQEKADMTADAPSFLQAKTERSRKASRGTSAALEPEDDGGYESKTGGVAQTLQSVLDKSQAQLSDARTSESKAAGVFEKFRKEAEAGIKSKEGTLADLKMQMSQSQQKAGQLKAALLSEQQLLKTSEEQLNDLVSERDGKTKSYEERTRKRKEEIAAVTQARTLLTSEAADSVLSLADLQHRSPPSFLELSRRLTTKAVAPSSSQVLPRAPSLLALQATSSRGRLAASEDPFGKVKSMVRGMLRKLTDRQSQDQKHATWCDSELGKSTKSKEDSEAEVQKLQDRIEEMDAEIAELESDVNASSVDQGEMQKAVSDAQRLRGEESAAAKTALAQYRDAQQLLATATGLLQKFYSQQSEGGDDSGYKANGAGSGIIGILQVAAADYAELEKDLSMSEEVAAKDFSDFMKESEVRLAVIGKDIEGNSRAKVKFEGNRMRSSADLKTAQKELEAITSYLEELKASCTIKGDSYEERQSRRAKELAGLKEALTYLRGDGMP